MANDKGFFEFIENEERRAHKQASTTVGKDESALDIVHDTVVKLSGKCGDEFAVEPALLHQNIPQNTIHEYFGREETENMNREKAPAQQNPARTGSGAFRRFRYRWRNTEALLPSARNLPHASLA